ncbi:hypothetical protein GCM10010912_49990 [Paenibacillus albidus]|uniref:Uncharacterized protein n=1 Tax=Paenibacillus albidus TaxID=2041023 RepID=A0A917CVK5_9BACL|nr:hypothetical protein GCM10010912_49990 [Paenibacillus albidus]
MIGYVLHKCLIKLDCAVLRNLSIVDLYVFKIGGRIVFKIAVTYFGNNELHSLEVGCGVSALKKT